MEFAAQEMPRYRCHKEVWALKIKAIEQPEEFKTAYPHGYWLIVPEDEGYGPIEVPHDYMLKHHARVGGYYVVYKDGYASYSPAEAFEDGYTRI